jgi:hypothetical protein
MGVDEALRLRVGPDPMRLASDDQAAGDSRAGPQRRAATAARRQSLPRALGNLPSLIAVRLAIRLASR